LLFFSNAAVSYISQVLLKDKKAQKTNTKLTPLYAQMKSANNFLQ
jgi:hypothetical protein